MMGRIERASSEIRIGDRRSGGVLAAPSGGRAGKPQCLRSCQVSSGLPRYRTGLIVLKPFHRIGRGIGRACRDNAAGQGSTADDGYIVTSSCGFGLPLHCRCRGVG